MKRIISFALILAMTFALAACTEETKTADGTEAPTEAPAITPTPTSAPTEAPTAEPAPEPIIPREDGWVLFNDGLVLFWLNDGSYKKGFMDMDGNIVIEPIYDHVEPVSIQKYAWACGLIAVGIGDKMGLIDTAGNTVVPLEYEAIRDFSENGIAPAKKEGKYGLIDIHGNVAADFVFEDMGNVFREGVIEAEFEGKWGYVDAAGNTVIDFRFDGAERFGEYGLAAVRIGDKWGYIDITGSFVIEPQFEMADEFMSDGVAIVWFEGEDGSYSRCVSTDGTVFDDPERDFESNNPSAAFGLRRFMVWDSETGRSSMGFEDVDGNAVIPARFILVGEFTENGLACAKTDKGWGFINTLGEFVIEPRFEELMSCNADGEACAMMDGKWGMIDLNGEWIIEPGYERDFHFYYADLAAARTEEGWYFINRSGEKVLGPFGFCTDFYKDGYAMVRINGCVGVIDLNGNWLIEPSANVYAFDW